LILLAIAGRLIPHPDNFTPVAAVALFGGAVLPGWRAIAVIVAALLLSDLLQGFSPNVLSLGVYGAFLAGVVLGRLIKWQPSIPTLGAAALGNSLMFFIISNFVVWALPHGLSEVNYAHTPDGLLECYVMALPFLRNAIAGDAFWTLLLFGLFSFGRVRLEAGEVRYKRI
jgi:hypothetical protein